MDGNGHGGREPRRNKAPTSEPSSFSRTDNIETEAWRHHAELSDLERRLLRSFAISSRVMAFAEERAAAFRLDVVTVLIANGALDGADWWRAIATEIGVPYRARLPTALVAPPFVDGRLCEPDPRVALIPATEASQPPLQAIAPRGGAVERLRDLIARHPELAARIVIAAPDEIADSVRRAAAPEALRHAVEGLKERAPSLSAHGVPNRRQIAALVLLVICGLALWHVWPALFVLAMCLPASAAFFIVSGVRFAAGLMPDRRPPAILRHGRAPRYLVLVPLYREAGVVDDLITALSELRYPRERLKIVIVLEAKDTETIAAVAGRRLPAHFATVVVPPGAPATKPRALAFALALFPSDLVTVYDAEDRPHHSQLIEAAQAFAAGSPRLACLQSPLVIDTIGAGSTWVSRQFAVEYDALFRRVLPMLAKFGAPVPLGGTSMHIKRAALDEVGGWDPHNVTEDADLGIRLARFGYRTECLALPTYEEAPMDMAAWVKQRSRWLKGWMVTWFVHMRDPARLWREAGLAGLLTLNLLVIGSVVAAVAYPLSLITLLLGIAGVVPLFADRSFWGDVWLIAFLLAFFSGIGASLWLTAVSAMRTRAIGLGELKLTLVYWALLFPAFARAVWELIVAPTLWQKTTHGRARRPGRRRDPLATSRRHPPSALLRGPGSPR